MFNTDQRLVSFFQNHPQNTNHDMHVSLFHKEKWCLDKRVIYITQAIEMNENGVCTIPYLQWFLSHFN